MDSRKLVGACAVIFLSSVIVSACGSAKDGESGFSAGEDGKPAADTENGSFDSNSGKDAGKSKDAGPDPNAFWANDPPPQWCGADAGATRPATPGGTPDCPDDKNRQGCPCKNAGETAPCWPGLRANRNRGVCHDGQTTCVQNGEFNKVWGECENYQLPDSNTKKGKGACNCFSEGQWAIANLSPCFSDNGKGPGSGGAASTYQDDKGNALCASGASSKPWSTDTLKVDCEGHYKLCYELKAGSAENPQPSDCTVAKVCVEGDYPKAGIVTPFPSLPAWSSTNTACSTAFASKGGYGEMSVSGLSVQCDKVDDGNGKPYVFNRVQYCPLTCNKTPDADECKNCSQGGSGGF